MNLATTTDINMLKKMRQAALIQIEDYIDENKIDKVQEVKAELSKISQRLIYLSNMSIRR